MTPEELSYLLLAVPMPELLGSLSLPEDVERLARYAAQRNAEGVAARLPRLLELRTSGAPRRNVAIPELKALVSTVLDRYGDSEDWDVLRLLGVEDVPAVLTLARRWQDDAPDTAPIRNRVYMPLVHALEGLLAYHNETSGHTFLLMYACLATETPEDAVYLFRLLDAWINEPHAESHL